MENKVALITGSGSGIGRDIAQLFCSNNIDLVLNDVDASALTETISLIKEMGGNAVGVVGDISAHQVNLDLVNTAFSTYGTLDIVVANAGITLFGDFLNYPEHKLDQVFNVNVKGTFLLAQIASRKFIEHKIKGCLLFMSSVTAHVAYKDLIAYSMSKSAIETLAKSLVVELSSYGIRVNTISPGATLTQRTDQEKGYRQGWIDVTPLGTYANTRDISEVTLFLSSEKAKHITGQNLIIDGGWTRTSNMPKDLNNE